MRRTEILVVGAGAAGLMAALELSKAGRRVTLLEARDRIGGRIHTLKSGFTNPVEAGAEFIHGDLPLTLKLVREAGLELKEMEGIFWNADSSSEDPFSSFGELLTHRLMQLQNDVSLADFLSQNFPGDEFASLRNAVRGFAEGYDAADPERFSAFAFRDEWMEGNEGRQYRIAGGYTALLEWMSEEVRKRGGEIIMNSTVKEITWKRREVIVTTSGKEEFAASKIIITIPLGVLTAPASSAAAVVFNPALKDKQDAAQQMGFGDVIKVLLEFRESFWSESDFEKLVDYKLPPVAFILSTEQVPTWWTQHPQKFNLLTGWIAGPRAARMKMMSGINLIDESLRSLASIFKRETAELRALMHHALVANWSVDPFALGAYTYSTVESSMARKILSDPVQDTIWFAGEALYDGPEMGTVEAALSSGMAVAKKIIAVT